MSWKYNVSTRAFSLNGVHQFYAEYAGAEGYKNDSANECKVNQGPLPRGTYTIGAPFTHNTAGAYTLRLTPDAGNSMCGRDGFLIHGDSVSNPGTASTGCIVLIKSRRKEIVDSGDTELIVE
ncbi:tlde1 domain-containing protein [Morganella sp. Je.2.23]|uniref:tlde1 domain-containing protein n=1 Tax=Morganella sp. Je.2.23 TaxID=3142840 RepID=UPI003DA87B58